MIREALQQLSYQLAQMLYLDEIKFVQSTQKADFCLF